VVSFTVGFGRAVLLGTEHFFSGMKRSEATYRAELEDLLEKYFQVPSDTALEEIVKKLKKSRLSGVFGKRNARVHAVRN
jgi:hypothetical protein